MTPLTPAAVTALAQQAAESPAHLDPQVVQQVCREWQIGQQAAALQRCIVEAAYQDKVKAEQQRDAALAEVRRLREQQDRERIARVEAIEQGNSLAQRLIEQRDAALAERDEAKRNSERMRLAVDATAELLSAASAERDALKTDLRLTQGVLAAAQHRLVAWGCRDGHNEDDCPLCSAEHSLLNTREAITEARRVLREVEWEASARICPICASAKRHGHLPDCRLKAALEGQP